MKRTGEQNFNNFVAEQTQQSMGLNVLISAKGIPKNMIKIKSLPKLEDPQFNLAKAIDKNKFLSRIHE